MIELVDQTVDHAIGVECLQPGNQRRSPHNPKHGPATECVKRREPFSSRGDVHAQRRRGRWRSFDSRWRCGGGTADGHQNTPWLSKFELEAKLDITRAGSARELAERAGSYGGARGAEIGVIEYVEKLGPEFKVHLLGDRISLNHRDIPLLYARSDQYIAAGIPKARRPIGQSLRQCGGREAIDIEPLRHSLGTGAIAYAIRP